MFQKCSFCPTLQIRGLLERSHSSHPTTVRAVNERLIRHAQGSPSGSLSPRAIGLCRTFRNSTPLFITAVSTYKGSNYQHTPKSSAKAGIIPPFVKGGEGGFLQSTRRGSALAVLHVAGCWRHGNMHQSRYRSAQTLSAQIPLYPPLRKGEKIGPEGLIASLIPGAARILWPSPPAPPPVGRGVRALLFCKAAFD